MHDARGKLLRPGDMVLVPAMVREAYETEDYCNTTLETLIGRRPDGQKETIHAINTGVLLKISIGDE
jgi:hypothetical protein